MDLRSFGLSENDLRELGYDVRGTSAPGGDPAPDSPSAPPPDRRPASPALRIWIATLVVLVMVGWGSTLQRRLPRAVPATAPDTVFSSARALALLVEIAQRPHPTGSPDLTRVRSLLLGRLNELGLDPEVQVATTYARDSSLVRSATVRNVVARIPGNASTGAVALVAHYDAAPLSPGAGDNALGVATLLEAVRTLPAAEPLRNDLLIVLTDGDELGQLGSLAFTEGHPWAPDVALTVAVESRGARGPALVFESLQGNGALIETMAAAPSGLMATSLGRVLRDAVLESAEASAVADDAFPDVALTVLGGSAWEDQTRDARDRVSERTLQHVGDQLLGLVRGIGDLDLERDLSSREHLYFSVPLLGLVSYPSGWRLPGALGLVLLWGLVGFVVRTRRGTRNGVLAGVVVAAATVGLSAAAASAGFEAVARLHPEFGLLTTAFYRDGPHVLALVPLALALASISFGLARRWFRTDEILLGALLTPLALSTWLTFSAPSAVASVQWPLALALVAAALLTVLGPRRGSSAWAWALVLLLSSAMLVLAVPSLQLTAAAWTLRGATALGALFGCTALLLLPLMDWLHRPKAWATPLVSLAATGTLVAMNLPAVQGAVAHPEPTTLVYLTDESVDAGPIDPGTSTDLDTSALRTVRGNWLTVPGPGEEWARSWVGEPPTGSTDPGVLLLGPDSLYEIAGTGPDAELAPPALTVASSATAGGRRSLVVEVTRGLLGEMIGLHVPDDVDASFTGVEDATWGAASIPTRSLLHWGVPEGGALRVGLSVPAAVSQVELLVLEHHLRTQELLGDYFFQRADSLLASGAMGSDRVIQRTVITIDVPEPVDSAPSGEQPPGSEEAL